LAVWPERKLDGRIAKVKAELVHCRETLRLEDVDPSLADYGEIPKKSPTMSGVYFGNGVLMTNIWSGHMLMVDTNDMIVAPHLVNIGMNEPHNTRILVSLIKPGDVFVDVGANVGYFSVLGAWRAYPGGQVWSFEPNPKVFPILSDNLTINGYADMAHRWPVALSDGEGKASLRVFPGYVATSTVRDVPEDYIRFTERETGRSSHLVEVELEQLDRAMRDVPEIHVMKIDVEGHEFSVIRGAQEIIRRSPRLKIVMEFNPSMLGPDNARGLIELARDLGFDIYSIEHDASLTRLDDNQALLAADFLDLLLVRPHAD
jgi:FkbM family methyltransferase